VNLFFQFHITESTTMLVTTAYTKTDIHIVHEGDKQKSKESRQRRQRREKEGKERGVGNDQKEREKRKVVWRKERKERKKRERKKYIHEREKQTGWSRCSLHQFNSRLLHTTRDSPPGGKPIVVLGRRHFHGFEVGFGRGATNLTNRTRRRRENRRENRRE
jgi:hypothetical protein